MPIIVGGGGPKRTPRLAARFASEFNAPFLSVERFSEQRERVIDACRAIDRDPATVTWSAAAVVCVGADDGEVRRRAEAIGREPDELRENGVAGTPSQAAATMERWWAAGVQRLYLQVLDLGDVEHLDAIAALPAEPHNRAQRTR